MDKQIEGPTPAGRKMVVGSNIFFLGLVSFFTDISTEMVYPILPLYLSAVMGTSPAIIGIIEGIAESLASIVKLFSGIIADRYGNKKKLAFLGYASSTINKIIILLSATWTGVLVARIIDRFGKGIRTAPRDALIAEAADRSQLGRAFGFHKTLDLLGTATGILLAYVILAKDNAYASIFAYSLLPAFMGLAVLLFVKDTKREKTGKKPVFRWRVLDKKLKLFLICIFIFTLGNSSNAFMLLRAYNAGFSPREAILLYFMYNLIASLLSYPVGKLSDKIGRRNMLCLGYILYGIVYLGMGLSSDRTMFISLFAIYGLYNALTSGGERALIAEMAPENQKASALGLHAAIVGLALLPASVIAGVLWENAGQAVPFIFGGTLAFCVSAGVYVILQPERSHRKTA